MRRCQRWVLCRTIFPLIALHFAAASHAATYVWNNNGTDWANTANWSPGGGPPGPTDVGLFNPNGSPVGTAVINPQVTSDQSLLSLTFAPNQNIGGWTVTQDAIPRTLTVGGSTGITTYGPATYSFNGTAIMGSSSTNTVSLNVNYGSTLVLQGNSAITSNQGDFNVNGGTLRLDNSGTNNAGRVLSTGNIRINGGGVFEFIGNSAGTATNLGTLEVVNNGYGGVNVIRVTPNGAQALVTFANSGTFSLRGGTRMVARYETTSGALGDSNGAQIKFVGTPFTGTASLLSNTSGGGTVGWAIVSDSF